MEISAAGIPAGWQDPIEQIDQIVGLFEQTEEAYLEGRGGWSSHRVRAAGYTLLIQRLLRAERDNEALFWMEKSEERGVWQPECEDDMETLCYCASANLEALNALEARGLLASQQQEEQEPMDHSALFPVNSCWGMYGTAFRV